MTSLWVTRWAAGATLSAALGVLGTTFLAQTPNQIPGGQKINTPPGAGVPAEPPSRASTDRVPNEANKVALPDYVVEPPDILSIEALEALPGRPITGEHLVQPNGKISLGFYGDLYVAGLTTSEIKAKVVLHLRKFLTDEVLGLERLLPDGTTQAVAPAESNRVFVQIAAYNSKVYYVQGALVTPGRLPVTGNETVLDAINFAGGILFADSGQAEITVFRPALDAKRELQKLAVDLKAIQRGDTRTNYQMMPGDRLVVARNPPLTDEEWGNARLMQKVQDQGARLDALEKKLDRILEKLDAQSPAPAPPAGK